MMLPIAADVEHRHVELFDLASADFTESFMHESVARVARERPNACAWVQGFADFVEARRKLSRAPDGFVFHVGRCGSTLLSNMLQASGEHLLIKEPEVVNDLMAGWLKSTDAERQELERVLGFAVRSLIGCSSVCARYRVVKLAAWNVRCGPSLLRLFPETRAVFVFRSPLETVASLLFQPPGWLGLIERPRSVQARFFPSLLALVSEEPVSPLQFFAHAFRSAAEAVFELPRRYWLGVDYELLVAEPGATLECALAHLGHHVGPSQLDLMVAASAIYSKDAKKQTRFEPSARHFRPPLSSEQAAEVLAIAGDAWERLRASTLPHSGTGPNLPASTS